MPHNGASETATQASCPFVSGQHGEPALPQDVSSAEQGATGCSEPEHGVGSREEGPLRGTFPYRSSFLTAAAEAGLIGARVRDCASGDRQRVPREGSGIHAMEPALMQASEDRTGCVEAEQSSRASAPLLGSRSSSQTLHRDSSAATPERM